jgi:hypothetical protein
MTIQQFITSYCIRPADAIVVKKESFGILDHYVVYLGVDQFGEHKFIANYSKGVRFLPLFEIVKFLQKYVPVRLNRFVGSELQRQFAVHRALSRLNENSYNLILNNCEHFSNWVQNGTPESDQVENFGNILLAGGAFLGFLGLASEDENLTGVGLLSAALGAIAKNAGK